MISINSITNQYDSASLEELANVTALNRQDTKFIFNSRLLPEVLQRLMNDYFILEIADHRSFNYNNLYYDTNEFILYFQHHNGCRPRFKIRFREYPESGFSFFEIKTKTNKNRTKKTRLKLPDGSAEAQFFDRESNMFSEQPIIEMISRKTPLTAADLFPSVAVKFNRITLVEKNFRERITIDNNLYTANESVKQNFDQVTISEVKQDRYNPQSVFVKTMRSMSIPETRFSKYCIGINYCYDIKHNRFKPRIRELNRISSAGNGR